MRNWHLLIPLLFTLNSKKKPENRSFPPFPGLQFNMSYSDRAVHYSNSIGSICQMLSA